MARQASPGRTIVMTGATRGLGSIAASRILKQAPDAHLVLLARGDVTALAARLRAESGNPHVSAIAADLSSLGSIRGAVAEIRSRVERGELPPLRGLAANAGLQLTRATEASRDGIEITFAVNLLANYALVDGLLDMFTPPARIVITTSDSHFGDFRHNMGLVPAPVWRQPSALAAPGTAEKAGSAAAGRAAYSTSKLGVIYLVHALARSLPAGMEIFSFNPGFVPGTGLARDGNAAARFAFRRIMPAMALTPWARSQSVAGADLAAAVTGPVPGASGSYLNGRHVEDSSRESYDSRREDELMTELARLTATVAQPHDRA
jgi:NAD(P)-dependent dehydrogenase (short-subunit alcohol dehydrogenase family)